MTPEQVLKQFFGYDSFHPGQEECIRAILDGRDTMAVMPTGAGKSLCYQIPALLFHGITLVISPLISLMQDQVRALNVAGIHAAYINSTLSETQMDRALSLAEAGRYRLIYIAPERLESRRFLEFAEQADISMLTVDEAHCISQWGQDFRPSYLKITDFIRHLPRRPVIGAFTATATRDVTEDICRALGLRDPFTMVTGFDRPNLYFGVEQVRGKNAAVLKCLRDHEGESGIIYCATRKNVDALFHALFKAGFGVVRYHAGMTAEERKQSQEDFVFDRAPVMIATNAFGMGIDKSNVRFVLHYNMPQSMESYYQEAGRAGRDGERADCILLFSPQDVVIDRMLIERKEMPDMDPEEAETVRERDFMRLRKMTEYCRTTGCLRHYILGYFGEAVSGECGNCSNCLSGMEERDMTEEARWLVRCVSEARGRFGTGIVTGALTGARRSRLTEVGADSWECYGALKGTPEESLKLLIPELVQRRILIQTEERYSVLKVGPRASELDEEAVRIMVRRRVRTEERSGNMEAGGNMGAAGDMEATGDMEVFHTAEKGASQGRQKASEKTRKERNAGKAGLSSDGLRLFEALRAVRTALARSAGVPPYIIFSDKTLIDMCVKRPSCREEMLEVTGVGEVKYERYGEEFLQAIREAGN